MAANRKYYIEGSTVRKVDEYSAAPARRRYSPELVPDVVPARPKKRPETVPAGRQNKSDRSWVDELKYGIAMTCAMIIVVGLCLYMLKLNADVKEEKNNISNLKSQLNAQLDENAEYSSGLESMTNLEEIYNIATNELGMVYSEPGQTVYYSQSNEDYVVQYKNVPEGK